MQSSSPTLVDVPVSRHSKHWESDNISSACCNVECLLFTVALTGATSIYNPSISAQGPTSSSWSPYALQQKPASPVLIFWSRNETAVRGMGYLVEYNWFGIVLLRCWAGLLLQWFKIGKENNGTGCISCVLSSFSLLLLYVACNDPFFLKKKKDLLHRKSVRYTGLKITKLFL